MVLCLLGVAWDPGLKTFLPLVAWKISSDSCHELEEPLAHPARVPSTCRIAIYISVGWSRQRGAGTLASSLTNKIANLFEPHFSHMRNVTGFRPGPPPYTEVFSAVAYRMVVAFGGDGERSALSLLWQPSLAIPSKRSI